MFGNQSKTFRFYPCPWPREGAFISYRLFVLVSQKKVSCGNVSIVLRSQELAYTPPLSSLSLSVMLFHILVSPSMLSFAYLFLLLSFSIIPSFQCKVRAELLLQTFLLCQHCCCKAAEDSNRCLSTAGQFSSALKDLCCR